MLADATSTSSVTSPMGKLSVAITPTHIDNQKYNTLTCVLVATKYKHQVETGKYSLYTMPVINTFFRSQMLGVGMATTRSLERVIIAPSLNTANSTMRRVGEYLSQP